MFTPSTYQPRFAGGHRQTLYAWGRPRQFPRLPAPVERYFDVAPDARVLAHCHWHRTPADHPTILLLHGLEGSSLAHYMCGMSDKAWAAGWNVVRLNQRNCGNTEHLCRGLYHSGLTHDAQHVYRRTARARRHPRAGRRRLFTGWKSGAQTGRRARGSTSGRSEGSMRCLPDHRPGTVRRCARAPRELRVSVEFRPQPQGTDAPEGRGGSRRVLPRRAARHLERQTIRRRLHGAVPWLSRFRRLLLSGERAARHRSHSRADADPGGRRRPVRAAGAIPCAPGSRKTRTSPWSSHRTADIADMSSAPTMDTTATGPSAK